MTIYKSVVSVQQNHRGQCSDLKLIMAWAVVFDLRGKGERAHQNSERTARAGPSARSWNTDAAVLTTQGEGGARSHSSSSTQPSVETP